MDQVYAIMFLEDCFDLQRSPASPQKQGDSAMTKKEFGEECFLNENLLGGGEG
jgi:hypothetical protein